MFTNQIVNGIRDYLKELAETSTQIEVNKYSLFCDVRKKVGVTANYNDYRELVSKTLMETIIEHNWHLLTKIAVADDGKRYIKYFIQTEDVPNPLDSRNRCYIPRELLEEAGYLPGDVCTCHLEAEDDGKLILYVTSIESNFKLDPETTVKTGTVTVEKTGGTRFTFPEHIRYFDTHNIVVY